MVGTGRVLGAGGRRVQGGWDGMLVAPPRGACVTRPMPSLQAPLPLYFLHNCYVLVNL